MISSDIQWEQVAMFNIRHVYMYISLQVEEFGFRRIFLRLLAVRQLIQMFPDS